ncbi:MAG TPA: ParA family protein [Casimicrobiaceae bacterium]|jgi:chromosome partitioning protein|nr:ParA family protein [Casimicrobiaceae bacterium]
MQTILVANPKGGSGKTTLATNVAGWLATRKQRVVLADFDPLRAATEWIARRPPLFPPIAGWTPNHGRDDIKERNPHWLIMDTPAGLHGESLRDAMHRADILLVPAAPSAFDMAATQHFLDQIGEYKAVKKGEIAIGLVAMRVDSRTNSAGELEEFLKAFEFPLVAHLRQTQVYVYCARDGLTVFDLPRSRAEQDWEQWRPLTRWIARQAQVRNA